jgi:REP element-mobilizing transposase RayT
VAGVSDLSRRHRRSIRLRGSDYRSAGAYYVTLVAQGGAGPFGRLTGDCVELNDAGRMVQAAWDGLADHYAGVEQDASILMPGHLHGIIVLTGAGSDAPGPARSLADLVQRSRTLTTKRYIDGVRDAGRAPFEGRLWQRNYYEHIIRDETSLMAIRQYIADNPINP